jgi:cyanophycinase-like exopeptidase
MPQYTNIRKSDLGFTVATVLDTEANLQTITVTAPGGQTATTTQPANLTRPSSATINSLTSQLEAAGVQNVNLTDISSATRASNSNVVGQAERAAAVATVSGTTVPENPQPPPPVSDTPTSTFVTEVNIAASLQSTSIVLPGAEDEQPPESFIQQVRQPTTQIFDDGSTLTESADGTTISSTPANDIVENGIGSTILSGLAVTGLAAGAAIIGGKLLKKAPESIQDTVRVAAITGAIGLATNALFGAKGLSTNKKATQGSQSNQNADFTKSIPDWRVKLSLADGSNYLYNSPDPGILSPLKSTKGVIFPYVPAISINYVASYEPTDITHSNYKIFSYRQSSVDSISISGEFTAQDTNEANYLLAVIHFFKSVTKMFYGQDQSPKPGTPPPLCYLTGMGAFQFDQHPLVITSFTYTLPTDVDYIRASYYTSDEPGVSQAINNTPYQPSPREVRLPQYLKPGGVQGPPQWKSAFPTSLEPTYVPTKMQIALQAYPIVTRDDISKRFSLKDYSNGDFYRGSVGKTNGRGIW